MIHFGGDLLKFLQSHQTCVDGKGSHRYHFNFFWLQWEVWDEDRLDDGLEIVSDDNKTLRRIPENFRGFDFRTAFVKGNASQFIDVTFKLKKYSKASTVSFGICPIQNYQKNIGIVYNYCIGDKGWKDTVRFDVYKGNITVNGQNIEYSGQAEVKAGDNIRILLKSGELEYFINEKKRYRTVQVDRCLNVCPRYFRTARF